MRSVVEGGSVPIGSHKDAKAWAEAVVQRATAVVCALVRRTQGRHQITVLD